MADSPIFETILFLIALLFPLILWPVVWFRLFARNRQFTIQAMAILVAGYAIFFAIASMVWRRLTS